MASQPPNPLNRDNPAELPIDDPIPSPSDPVPQPDDPGKPV